MDKEYKENFNNLDNYELKDSTPCYKKKCFIVLLSLTIIIIILVGVFLVYFFILSKCEIGDEEKCHKCHRNECASCNLGFKLSKGKCIIDYSIKAE